MAPLLPVELQQILQTSSPCRNAQVSQLATLYNNCYPSPPILFAYGLEDTGKLGAITSVLEARILSYALVKCTDCLSQRHLLSKIFAGCIAALEEVEQVDEYGKIDTLNSLVVTLQKLFEKQQKKLVLLIDGIERQRGGSATLLPALARLPDLIPNISLILVSSSPRPISLHKAGVLCIQFPPYTRNEAITLVTSSPPPLHPGTIADQRPEPDELLLKKLYAQYAATVYDSLIAPTSSTSVQIFRSTCERLWPRFIWPYLSDETPPGKAKTWDFTRLLIRNRTLFQIDGENALVDRLRPVDGAWTFEDLQQQQQASSTMISPANLGRSSPPLLTPFSTLLLTAAYLASHTSPKLDILLFSRLSSTSKTHRVRKNYHKRKALKISSADYMTPGEKGALRATKKLFDAKSGVGRHFGVERVVAVVRAIHPDGVGSKGNSRGIADSVYKGMAELERLGLLVCVGAGAGSDEEERWRINVGRDWVDGMAEKCGLGVRVGEYAVQGD